MIDSIVEKEHYVSKSAHWSRVVGTTEPENQIFVSEEWANEVGRRISVALVKRNWDQAHAILKYEEKQRVPKIEDVYNVPIPSLNLQTRVINYLSDIKPNTLQGLTDTSDEELRSIPSVGVTIVNQIRTLVEGIRNVTVNGNVEGPFVAKFFQ